MGDIDYSKNDFIDINNRLFRLGRNNISENSKGIKDLDDDNKPKGEKNLVVYGSELINNLNQINYTFKQLEDYIFVPIKGKTKKDIKKIIDKGPTTPLSELKEETPLLDDAFEAFASEDIVPDLETDIPEYQQYQFTDDKKFSLLLPELEAQIQIVGDEISRINTIILDELTNRGFNVPPEGLENSDFIDFIMGRSDFEDIKRMMIYYFDLNRERIELLKLIEGYEEEDDEEPEKPVLETTEPVLETTEPVLETTEPVLETTESVKKSKNIKFPEPGKNLDYIKEIYEADGIDDQLLYLRKELKTLGFKGQISKLNKKEIKNLIDVYESKTTGAGMLRLRGGAGKKKGVRISKTPKTPTTPITPTTSGVPSISPPVVDDEEDFEDETDPTEELKMNDIEAKKLDKTLKNTANTSQKSPIPGYITKIYELMTNLIQFIGRTNVLYISRIKKNLNYLDEDQVTLIYEAIMKFKNNLQILKDFKNKGSALIKDTLYNQVEKETLNLYNEIYNSIRNYSKMKDYTVMAGSGIPLLGGYFIQSDSPFIRHSTTKRFL